MSSSKGIKLSRRQTLLLSRLTAIVEDVKARKLPIDVLEIIGFGSFFRGKANPKDVDLLLRCPREHSAAFQAFRETLHHVCSDVNYQYDFDRPLAAFLNEFDRRNANMLPQFISLDQERALFASWLEPYSWHMLFPKTIMEQASWDDPFGFTRRLLRRTLPNLNVVYYIYPETSPDELGLGAGYMETIWSPDRPDIRQNAIDCLNPANAYANTLKELDNFERQLFLLQASITVLQSYVRSRTGQTDRQVSESCWKELQSQNALLTEEEIEAELGECFQPSKYSDE